MGVPPTYTAMQSFVSASFKFVGLWLDLGALFADQILELDRKSLLTVVYAIILYIILGLYVYYCYYHNKRKKK